MNAFARTGLGILLALAPVLTPAADELPPFEGQTIADAVLKRDALKVITLIIHAKLSCTVIDRVKAEPAVRHRHVALPGAAGPATYERWTVSACSKEQPFSVTFYPAKDGGMMFRVQPEKVSDS
jgi:hypothetical protein